MNKSSKLLSVIALSTMFTLAQPIMAMAYDVDSAQQEEQHPKHMKHKLQRLTKALALTEEQQQKIKAIFAQAKERRAEHKSAMVGFKEQVRSLMTSAVFDDKAFIELHNQYQDQLTEAALQRAKTKHAMTQVLTQEQSEKFAKMKKRHMPAMF